MTQLKNYLILFLLFNFTLHSQVTITSSNLKVNNNLISNNVIVFDNNPSITISLNVHMETPNESVDNTFGNLYLYYKKNANDAPTQIGFQSITFAKNYPKTNYFNDTYFSPTTLYKNFFFNTGGIIYAEYKSNNNKTYQSSQIQINGGSLTNTPPTPPTSINQPIITQNIRYSDNFPITNSNICVTTDASTYFDVDILLENSESIAGSSINIYLRKEEIGSTTYGDGETKRIPLKSVFYSGVFNNYISLKDISINANTLDFTKYTYTLKIEILKHSKSTNLNVISSNIDFIYKDSKVLNVILTKPISYNTIADNQTLVSGQTSAPFTSLSPWVDYTIPCTRRGCIPIYDRRDITIFKWQTRTQNTNWTDISDATSKEYSPNKTFTENTYYRRVAFYNNGQYNISNTILIQLSNQNFLNNICCDQILPSGNSQPQEITGNIPNFSNFTYQWQICTDPTSPVPVWSDLANSINQNYKHNFTEAASRGTFVTGFRRLIKSNSLVISTSNTINVNRPRETTLNSSRLSNNTESAEIGISIKDNTIVNIYPNPIVNSFYIDGLVDINNVIIYDSFGVKLNIEKYQKSKDLIEVNTSRLQAGIFILKIDNTTFSKTLIKN